MKKYPLLIVAFITPFLLAWGNPNQPSEPLEPDEEMIIWSNPIQPLTKFDNLLLEREIVEMQMAYNLLLQKGQKVPIYQPEAELNLAQFKHALTLRRAEWENQFAQARQSKKWRWINEMYATYTHTANQLSSAISHRQFELQLLKK